MIDVMGTLQDHSVCINCIFLIYAETNLSKVILRYFHLLYNMYIMFGINFNNSFSTFSSCFYLVILCDKYDCHMNRS